MGLGSLFLVMGRERGEGHKTPQFAALQLGLDTGWAVGCQPWGGGVALQLRTPGPHRIPPAPGMLLGQHQGSWDTIRAFGTSSGLLLPQASTPKLGNCSGTGPGGPCGCWRGLSGSAPPRPCDAASARAAWAAQHRGTRSSSAGTAPPCPTACGLRPALGAPRRRSRSAAGAACGTPSTSPRTSCSCRATASSM